MAVYRIFAEKKKGFDVEAENLLSNIRDNLNIKGLESVRIINRYDISGINMEEYSKARTTIFSEPPVDSVHDEYIKIDDSEKCFAVEYLPGQYDQRADSTSQCLMLLTGKDGIQVRSAKVYALNGNISNEDLQKIKEYCINPVESREASFEKPATLDNNYTIPRDVEIIDNFIYMNEEEISEFRSGMGLAMSLEDIKFCRDYFKNTEKRNPTVTEIRVIDTYWSDHCRHTTFLTSIKGIDIEDGRYSKVLREGYERYLKSRELVYGNTDRDICLMDMAVVGAKELVKKGHAGDLDISDEINACSINAKVDVDGENEDWLIMFKNETHNHPTEIEPFGGAATCLGGAIRDPLSGRAYVYQAMRVTGSADPREKVSDTLKGKLPQRKITTGAAAGYSSYGNQIGLSTGHVSEIYHEGYKAKRMEIGAVIGAAPKKNIRRETPGKGDAVILLGGRTGRDGCGGATGSSKEHDEKSILNCGAEVQKGNPPTERKIQRLFRNPDVTTMIKRCNDFGAGGVAVAIGEIAQGLNINLDSVLKKYEGLDGTEIAISESQERMAVVVEDGDVEKFIKLAGKENLEAVVTARVTDDNRLRMSWRGKTIVDISRDFLNTNGVRQETYAVIKSPDENTDFFNKIPDEIADKESLKEMWLANLERLNVCSQRGLVERFDSTIGSGTVLMPFGGKYQLTPAQVMAAKVPVLNGETNTGTIMSYGCNPYLSEWSPFHGGVYAVVEAAAKIAAAGGDYKSIRLSMQEYFERLGTESVRWGKPAAALLGAHYAQMRLGIPAIGGKDSMSGTFMDLTVPPTIAAFGVNVVDVRYIISPEFKKAGNDVVLINLPKDIYGMPDFTVLERNYNRINELIKNGIAVSAYVLNNGGIAEAVTKMGFGNGIGMVFNKEVEQNRLFTPNIGSIVLEVCAGIDIQKMFEGTEYEVLGQTTGEHVIAVNGCSIELEEAVMRWEKPLEKIFPTKVKSSSMGDMNISFNLRSTSRPKFKAIRPKVLIPVFSGTNCEYDSAAAFERAGGEADIFVVRSMTPADIRESTEELVKRIKSSQIIMIPGGFSAGDEPEGSGKFIATVFRNPDIKEAVMDFLNKRDGLMLGICNGFQALIKLGLLPYGEIRDIDETSPTLTFNSLGRHVSRMVRTKVVSTLSPWFSNASLGDIHTIAISHGEGRFTADSAVLQGLIEKGQVAAQYVDMDGKPSMDIQYNPNGSVYAVECITSPDGRILGKMGHSERTGSNVAKNIPCQNHQRIFEAGVNYFK